MFKSRILHDPVYGHGVELSVGDDKDTSYLAGLALGFTDSLFKVNLELTPPFDTHKLNTRGNEEKGRDLVGVSLRVAVLWVQVSIDFLKVKNWILGIDSDLESLLQVVDK